MSASLREEMARILAKAVDVDYDSETVDREELHSLVDELLGALHTRIPTMEVSPRTAVVRDVIEEMRRQDAMWGEQNHPDGTPKT